MLWLLKPQHRGDRVNLGFTRQAAPLPYWDGSMGLQTSRMEPTSLYHQVAEQVLCFQLENTALGSQQGETQSRPIAIISTCVVPGTWSQHLSPPEGEHTAVALGSQIYTVHPCMFTEENEQ